MQVPGARRSGLQGQPEPRAGGHLFSIPQPCLSSPAPVSAAAGEVALLPLLLPPGCRDKGAGSRGRRQPRCMRASTHPSVQPHAPGDRRRMLHPLSQGHLWGLLALRLPSTRAQPYLATAVWESGAGQAGERLCAPRAQAPPGCCGSLSSLPCLPPAWGEQVGASAPSQGQLPPAPAIWAATPCPSLASGGGQGVQEGCTLHPGCAWGLAGPCRQHLGVQRQAGGSRQPSPASAPAASPASKGSSGEHSSVHLPQWLGLALACWQCTQTGPGTGPAQRSSPPGSREVAP